MTSTGNLSRNAVRAASQASEHTIRSSSTKVQRSELQARSLYLWVWPAPVNFTERRSILKALQQHGPVESFKWLPGQSSSNVLGSIFISLMKESQDAAKAISSSPLNITVPRSSTEPTSVVKMDGLKAEFQKPRSSEEQKSEFLVEISETLTYRHEQSAKNSPLTRPWPEFVVKSPTFASKTLERSLPDNMAAIGLRHWDVDLGQQEVADNKRFEREQMRNWLPSKIKDPAAKSKASHDQQQVTSSAASLEFSTENTAETSTKEKMVETLPGKAAEEKTETSIGKPADDIRKIQPRAQNDKQ